MSLNRVLLLGSITGAPEVRYTSGGLAVGTITVTTTRSYTYKGEQREETTTIPVTTFGKLAERHADLAPGSPVLVEGRIQSREYETRGGERRSVIEVVADRVQVLGRAREPAEGRAVEAPATAADGLPF